MWIVRVRSIEISDLVLDKGVNSYLPLRYDQDKEYRPVASLEKSDWPRAGIAPASFRQPGDCSSNFFLIHAVFCFENYGIGNAKKQSVDSLNEIRGFTYVLRLVSKWAYSKCSRLYLFKKNKYSLFPDSKTLLSIQTNEWNNRPYILLFIFKIGRQYRVQAEHPTNQRI